MNQFTQWGLFEPVKDYVKTCDTCQRIKVRNTKSMGSFGSKMVNRIGENWMMNVIGTFLVMKEYPKY